MKFKIIESYLDDKEEFWDYHTKDIKKWIIPNKIPYSSEIFDTSTLGTGTNVTPEWITYMTPREYFERCAKGFGNTFENQIRQIEGDKETLQHLRDVIFKYHRAFPITYISNSNGSRQEGRHRMYIAAEILGWDKSFPVELRP